MNKIRQNHCIVYYLQCILLLSDKNHDKNLKNLIQELHGKIQFNILLVQLIGKQHEVIDIENMSYHQLINLQNHWMLLQESILNMFYYHSQKSHQNISQINTLKKLKRFQEGLEYNDLAIQNNPEIADFYYSKYVENFITI
ncbi:unnamed protein product [Paramecium sonneborni]|uniref:Uncharacterized protein n=1 Tax=Paramecium sonneborni TaxID=65129 RepID=A0A8S1RVJ4_9CILI|nr:unnamed protein product [Paramecium sonneborni]